MTINNVILGYPMFQTNKSNAAWRANESNLFVNAVWIALSILSLSGQVLQQEVTWPKTAKVQWISMDEIYSLSRHFYQDLSSTCFTGTASHSFYLAGLWCTCTLLPLTSCHTWNEEDLPCRSQSNCRLVSWWPAVRQRPWWKPSGVSHVLGTCQGGSSLHLCHFRPLPSSTNLGRSALHTGACPPWCVHEDRRVLEQKAPAAAGSHWCTRWPEPRRSIGYPKHPRVCGPKSWWKTTKVHKICGRSQLFDSFVGRHKWAGLKTMVSLYWIGSWDVDQSGTTIIPNRPA